MNTVMFLLKVGFAVSLGFVFGSWCYGITDTNDLTEKWFMVFGPWTTLLWILCVVADPKSMNPFGETGIWSIFMLQMIAVPVTILFINGVPFDGYIQLAKIGFCGVAAVGLLFVILDTAAQLWYRRAVDTN